MSWLQDFMLLGDIGEAFSHRAKYGMGQYRYPYRYKSNCKPHTSPIKKGFTNGRTRSEYLGKRKTAIKVDTGSTIGKKVLAKSIFLEQWSGLKYNLMLIL